MQDCQLRFIDSGNGPSGFNWRTALWLWFGGMWSRWARCAGRSGRLALQCLASICKHAKHTTYHDTIISVCVVRESPALAHATISLSWLVMPPRISLGAPRSLSSRSTVLVRPMHCRRFASSSANVLEIYDVVCVGGGPAGLSLLTGLKASPITSALKVALIEGQDLQKSRLPQDASLDTFSNRCSSLTPASVRNLQGMNECMKSLIHRLTRT